jgi:hypothetical protein
LLLPITGDYKNARLGSPPMAHNTQVCMAVVAFEHTKWQAEYTTIQFMHTLKGGLINTEVSDGRDILKLFILRDHAVKYFPCYLHQPIPASSVHISEFLNTLSMFSFAVL